MPGTFEHKVQIMPPTLPVVRILSYFSLPTDLAAAMRDWPEFVSGDGYDVELRGADGVDVSIRYVEPDYGDEDVADDVEVNPHVLITASIDGPLFQRAVACARHELVRHSDTVMVERVS